MRPHRRRGPLEQVLVAGDLADLDSIRALLAWLPEATYGQVIVETAADQELPPLAAPARVTVTRIVRPSVDALDPTSVFSPGELLARAVAAWVAEWIPDEPQTDRTFSIWVGASARNRVHAPAALLESL